jgi:hypothetical protein
VESMAVVRQKRPVKRALDCTAHPPLQKSSLTSPACLVIFSLHTVLFDFQFTPRWQVCVICVIEKIKMAQALSLVCNDCGVLLRSVKEAQDHGEATGETWQNIANTGSSHLLFSVISHLD